MGNFSRQERLRSLLDRQHGRVTRAQLDALGFTGSNIARWIEHERATRVLPKVYALGHTAPSREADLWAAVLYAGPDAMLSHMTAAHWYGWLSRPSQSIEVSTPRSKIQSLPGAIRVHNRRPVARAFHHGMPITRRSQTLLDLASLGDPNLVRRALAQLDYRRELNVAEIERACGRGRPGSRLLRRALKAHQPRLAYANGRLEEDFLLWCAARKLPLPRLNVPVHGVLVDAYWPAHALVVELDGHDNHSSRAQLRRDHANDLALRATGITVLRYDWALLHGGSEQIYRELVKHTCGVP
jgi:very-short-patch-repair endonuclease